MIWKGVIVEVATVVYSERMYVTNVVGETGQLHHELMLIHIEKLMLTK